MRVAVVGVGYVGLVTGACLAELGHSVVCVDVDPQRIERLTRGEVPIHEPGLESLIAANAAAGRLRFSSELGAAVPSADVVLIAVGTPSDGPRGDADLAYVYSAAAEIARHIKGFTVVATKSTVPVGTGDEVERIIATARDGPAVAVVANPEFLREGSAVGDFMRPDRIVIGTDSERARRVMAELYRPLRPTPVLFTGRRTAELTKYAANAFLAMKVAFINEFADLCDAVGADVTELATGLGLDTRIGPNLLRPGPGFGGSCFPKDILALERTAAAYGAPLSLAEATLRANATHLDRMTHLVVGALGSDLDVGVSGKRVALLGLTFKAGTDDVRESPALRIAASLLNLGCDVIGYDPQGMPNAATALPTLRLAASALDAVQGSDAIVIATEWPEFLQLDLMRLKGSTRAPVIVDLRNLLTRADAEAAGFTYVCIGRPSAGGTDANVPVAS